MSDSVTARAAAGVSFLFNPGERPDAAAWRVATDATQTRARIVREDVASGCADLVLDGLSFDLDGLAPAPPAAAPEPSAGFEAGEGVAVAAFEVVRLYPGHHLSGGLGMAPIVRALVALAAETAVRLPVRAVQWHPAGTTIEPQAFAHAAWAWLAGGDFPAHVLTALVVLADGSVASRGLIHFTGQEMTLRPGAGETSAQALRLGEAVVHHMVLHGAVTAITKAVVSGERLCLEPAQRGTHVWVWRSAD